MKSSGALALSAASASATRGDSGEDLVVPSHAPEFHKGMTKLLIIMLAAAGIILAPIASADPILMGMTTSTALANAR